MSSENDLSDLDLAALLTSKVCHDIISPVGAITNGLEMLAEDHDEQTNKFAMELIVKSASQASAKLKFARLAFGASGAVGTMIDVKDAEIVSREYVDREKVDLTWQAPQVLMPKNFVKLLLNLVLISISTIPKGGKLSVIVSGDGDNPGLEIIATGERLQIPEIVGNYFGGDEKRPADAHAAQPYYARKLADISGLTVTISETGDGVLIATTPG